MPQTRIWHARVPIVLWPDLIISGKLNRLVNEEIEKAMAEHGFVKMKHGRRWFWFEKTEVEAAAKLGEQ